MLNSAAAVTLPCVREPPIRQISGIRPAMRGSFRRARAMLVNGPVGTSVTPSVRMTVTMMKSTACMFTGLVAGTGRSGASHTVLPWISRAWRGARAIQPRLAVDLRGVARRADQGMRGPLRDRNACEPGEFHDLQRVGGDLVDALVSRDGGDAQHVETLRRQQNRHGVVVAGIAIEDHLLCHITPPVVCGRSMPRRGGAREAGCLLGGR